MSEYIIYSGFTANPLEIFDVNLLEKFYHEVKHTTRDEFTKIYEKNWQDFIDFWTHPEEWERTHAYWEEEADLFPDVEMINYQHPVDFYQNKIGRVIKGPKTVIMINNPKQGTDEAITFYSRNAAIDHLARYFNNIIDARFDPREPFIPYFDDLLEYLHWLDDQDKENTDNNHQYFKNQNIIVEIKEK